MDSVKYGDVLPPETMPINKGTGMDWISFPLGSVIFVALNCKIPGSDPEQFYKRVHAYQWNGTEFRLLQTIPEDLKAEMMLNVMRWPNSTT